MFAHAVLVALAALPSGAAPARVTVLVLGDSIAAGYGIAADDAFPALVERMAREAGLPWRVVNGGISGDTTSGGLARLEWALKAGPDFVLVELGANDGLRGVPPAAMRANLGRILERLRARGVRAALAGMRLPPNYGPAHAREFERSFRAVARAYGVPLLPFILEGVAAKEEFNLADGIHPNADGHRVIARSVFSFLRPLLSGGDADRRP